MKDITILEAAKLLGFTKNAVKYQAAKLPAEMTYKDENGITRIKPAGIKELRAKMGQKGQETTSQQTTQQAEKNHERTTQTTTEENALFSALLQTVETLRAQLAEKDKQLGAKDRQLEALSNALQAAQQSATQAQALHAGTMQQALLEAKEGATNADTVADTSQEKKKKGGFFSRWRK